MQKTNPFYNMIHPSLFLIIGLPQKPRLCKYVNHTSIKFLSRMHPTILVLFLRDKKYGAQQLALACNSNSHTLNLPFWHPTYCAYSPFSYAAKHILALITSLSSFLVFFWVVHIKHLPLLRFYQSEGRFPPLIFFLA